MEARGVSKLDYLPHRLTEGYLGIKNSGLGFRVSGLGFRYLGIKNQESEDLA